MPGLAGKISKFLATPQGRRLTGQAVRKAQQLAANPRTRARMLELATKLNQRGAGPGTRR
ncbi:hypothetical protein CLV92_11070 [Kineococcus xinjiangensis]|uniref:Uncharacterized protein n=1 Tax=Kineococcus xinjiangensis TaxID=512762 RepID=A0A2S6IGV1_9ACTN|nr:hypothetical protein [Kineococcus xinjiangensis]PPK93442.1 hypothetical protein CLV92_11070 [Kineococcus xinjiangensis]